MVTEATHAPHPHIRQVLYAILSIEAFIFASTVGKIVAGVPDNYPHQHLYLLSGPLGVAAICGSQLASRLAVKRWLLVIAFALIGVQYFFLSR